MKKLRVTVEGKTYEVLVEMLDGTPVVAPAPGATPRALPAAVPPPAAAAPAPAPAGPAAAGPGDIVSPLAGRIVSIDVKVGQTVAAGAQVATVEAMKMNTYIYATAAGTVAAVLVAAGDAVEEGAPLLRLA
jgi:glutaconyl-CoA/methylmalonyl-CoA decarboxylase subunit gamma